MSKPWQNSEAAVPLIPTHPSDTRVRVDCPYCGNQHLITTVDQRQECECGGRYHCEYPHNAHSKIYARGFPRKAPKWWSAGRVVATMAESQ